MDTRTKILTVEAARGLHALSPVVLTGYFDILRAEQARQIENERRRYTESTLVAFVLPSATTLLPQPARAEMAAALRVIDYVVTGDASDLTVLINALQPLSVVHLETDEERRYRELVQHVHRRQGR